MATNQVPRRLGLAAAAILLMVLPSNGVSAQPVVPGGPGCGKGPPAAQLKTRQGAVWYGSACMPNWFLNVWSYTAPEPAGSRPETVLSLFRRSKGAWHATVAAFESADFFDYMARHYGYPVGTVHLLTLDAWEGWRPPSFVVRSLRGVGEPQTPLPNPPGMANCSPFELTTLAQEEGANLYGGTSGLTATACNAGWAIGQATYYTDTVPRTEVAIAAVFKWSNTSGWIWRKTLSQSQAEAGIPGMPPRLAYELVLQQQSCPASDPTC